MYTHDPDALKGRFTRCAAIAFSTADIERALSAADDCPEVRSQIGELVAALWEWQQEDHVQGKINMSPEEARTFPSYRLYSHDEPLLRLEYKLDKSSKIRHLLRCARGHLAFALWQMHGMELTLNPGMPFVASCDIAEVDWRTLSEALDHAINASADPQATILWQRQTIARLIKDHPAQPGAPRNGVPVTRDYFFNGLETGSTTPVSHSATNKESVSVYRHDRDSLEYKFTYYAEVAFMTVVIERLSRTLAEGTEARAMLTSLVDDLWAWQSADKIRGEENMSEEAAKAMPSYAFDQRVEAIRSLAEAQPELHLLLSSAADALGYIAWTMEGVESALNPGKPYVISDEWDDRDIDTELDALEAAATASTDPSETFAWQQRTIQRLIHDHPSSSKDRLGEPLSRDYFK